MVEPPSEDQFVIPETPHGFDRKGECGCEWLSTTHGNECPQCQAPALTASPSADQFAEQFGDKPVCKGEVWDDDPHPGMASMAEIEAWERRNVNRTKPEPTYTMQQAIDRIVDGLCLVWGGRIERVAAKTVFGEYVVYLAGTESHGQWWSWHLEQVGGDYIANGEVDACDDDGRLKALSDCLADYKSRLRAELEKAVKHGS